MVNFHTNCCRIIREVVELAAKGQVSIFRRGHSDSRYVNIELTEDHGELKPAVDMTVTVKVEGEAAELAALGSARTRTSEVFNSNRHLTHFGRAQAILRSGTIAGKVSVTVSCENCEEKAIDISVGQEHTSLSHAAL